MKKAIWVAMLLLLGACVREESFWDRPGATEAELKQDKYTCFKEAAHSAPPASGQVVSSDGFSVYSEPVDVNEGTRNTLFMTCMEAKGWTFRTRLLDLDGTVLSEQ